MNEFTLDELKKIVDSCLGGDNAAKLTAANLDVELHDLGYDSLTVYEFATKLQDDLAINITDRDIDTMTTPRTVLDLVNGRLTEATSR